MSSYVNVSWDFGYHMRNEASARRPDATINYKENKLIQFLEMSCPSENNNIYDRMTEKRKKCQKLSFEIRERRPGLNTELR